MHPCAFAKTVFLATATGIFPAREDDLSPAVSQQRATNGAPSVSNGQTSPPYADVRLF
jgi:hypothetical protein